MDSVRRSIVMMEWMDDEGKSVGDDDEEEEDEEDEEGHDEGEVHISSEGVRRTRSPR